jgi:energy-coupling factor transporter ATP-binding protein EcfA2
MAIVETLTKGAVLDAYERPLRPLRMEAHLKRYKEIDNYGAQFDRFQRVFDEPDTWSDKGHLFIVTGDRGYGKTSLRQRCAFWMLAESKLGRCDVQVVDLSDENWETDTIDVRLTRVRERMLHALERWLHADAIARVRGNADMINSFYELGVALRLGRGRDGKRPVVAVVLLPGYPEPLELERFYGVARGCMVFLAEMFDPDSIDKVKNKVNRRLPGFQRDDIDPYILPLGTLKAGDDELLMQWIEGDLKNCPKLTGAYAEEYLKWLIREYPVGASQVIKLLVGVLGYAIDSKATEVTDKHIERYMADSVYRQPV